MSNLPQVIDYKKLQNSTFSTWAGLVGGSWLGLMWSGLLTLPVGVGALIWGGSAFGGFIAVPLWGTVWGLAGLSRARESGAKANGVTLLGPDHPLTQITHRLCDRLGMEAKPWVGTMAEANAYAIGSKPEKSLVVIGTPLLDRLEPMELAAIIGHELGHIANNDMRRMGFARSFQNALVWFMMAERFKEFARWVLTWGSELAVLRLSRKREYWADAIGAALTTKEAMIGALEKIHATDEELAYFERQHARIMFRGFAGTSMLSTHPTCDERVAAVRAEVYLQRLPVLKRDGFPSPTTETPALSSRAPVSPAASDLAY